MHLSEPNQVDLVGYLKVNGHTPTKISFGNAWFRSPLRHEKTASFKVNLARNLWFDFGSGEGGTFIDLVMKMNHVNFKEALGMVGNDNVTFIDHKPEPSEEHSRIKVEGTQPIRHSALIQYLNIRNVSLPIARLFLQEANYTVHGKRYFALAFKNDKGGFELRNAFFKTGSSPKYYTTIPGTDDSKINVFEGFMDFLSCCTYYNTVPGFPTIVLNSLSFLSRIETALQQAREVYLFLDNDTAGKTATQKVKDCCGKVTDWSQIIYPDHKDFNEFIMARKCIQVSSNNIK